MICGHNQFVTYDDALPCDYFFTENGWSIWGLATWKRCSGNREFPFDYADNDYIKRCLKENLNEFWYEKVSGYCDGKLVDNHVPGGEYFHAVNGVLFHRMAIMPTKNMICNVGYKGAHFDFDENKKVPIYFGAETYEIEFPLKHPKYVIDDKHFGKEYDKLLHHVKVNPVVYFFKRVRNFFRLLFTGKLISVIKRKRNPTEEK